MSHKTITLAFLFTLIGTKVYAQVDRSSDLYKTIVKKDSLLFNEGFNNCNIDLFKNIVSDKFEFYHDQAGVTDSKANFILGIKNGLCKLDYKARRVLDTESTKVYPLKNNGVLYGAIQNGVHTFYAKEKNKEEYITTKANFTHVWLLENEEWKFARGLSYNHKDVEKPIDKKSLFIDRTETNRWLKQKQIPAVGIGYIENGIIKSVSVFGELEEGVSAPKNTIWNVASLTKPIISLLTLKLINNGDWNLDDPIYKYWVDPDVKNDDRHKTLTTRHILSHQTGFSNWRWSDEESQKLQFNFDPGTQYQYSGEGFEYLKKAIENKFELSIEKLVDSLIFKPLTMMDTRFCWDQKMDESRFAKWFDSKGNQYETFKGIEASAADDLLTTVEDYSKFITYVINGAGISKKLYKDMVFEQVKINDYQHMGLGWWVDENINSNNDYALVHGGDDIGVHTIVFLIPKTKQGLLIFTNSDNGTEIFEEILLIYLGENGKGILEIEMKRK